jgi:hypothetical protein
MWLGVDSATTYDEKQRKIVMTSKLKSSIIGFQKSKNLLETGQLDYATLKVAAKADVYPFLVKAKK